MPAKLAWMAASELVMGAATQFKLRGSAAKQISNQLKPNGPGVFNSLGVQGPSLYWMAAPNIDWEATIQSSFAGSDNTMSVMQILHGLGRFNFAHDRYDEILGIHDISSVPDVGI
ncbi:hypothetical protein PSTG_13651 [Puccinia striiformis f. sp. tritici PST-78]|uniref:Uncharacterized protein n=1 Tax=Puccinia striiformis f. sp. tritici PST-78 TaxID=1165861 RepID=A0A0L0V0X2_9BASI|nr:hypothetical protein PSTG_13651 [Puccinia striiformis f. sp. tritici PST-78]